MTLLKAQIAEEAAEFAKVGLGSDRQKSCHVIGREGFFGASSFTPVVGRCQVQNLYKSELQEAMKVHRLRGVWDVLQDVLQIFCWLHL